MDFRNYYKLPLKVDEYCPFYIMTSDNEMALNYLNETNIELNETSEIYDIVGVINGYINDNFESNISNVGDDIIDINGVPTLMIRGWGNLISSGGHNLTYEEAIEVQNSFRDWIINRLNGNL